MRIVVWFLLASMPLSASSADLYAQCSTAPTTQGPDSASCGDFFDSASATVNGFNVAADASAGSGGGYTSYATASFSDGPVITFFGGTGEGFAKPSLTASGVDSFGSSGVATASLGWCMIHYFEDSCAWNSVQFIFGLPETQNLFLYAGAAAFGELHEDTSADGEASFNGFLGFYDAYGNPLSGVTYEIGSPGQSSPEPGTLLLTAMAGAALLACSRRHGG
jgi:hypothetical protein